MIKLVIFDLDGVLADAREIHYDALNLALDDVHEDYVISREEHLSTYDGLPTTKKLKMLTENKGLPVDEYNNVWSLKQYYTVRIIKNNMVPDPSLVQLLSDLKDSDYQICVASNSIRESVKMMLMKLELMEYVDFFYSNEDVKSPKPSTEMYLECMIKAAVDPVETLIVEDSHVGRRAVINSGAHLCAVENPAGVTQEHIYDCIENANKDNKEIQNPKWQGGKMNILIPMAGEGSRFADAGYTFPKPLIDIDGKPMIQRVIENLNIDAQYIFVVRKEHKDLYNIHEMLEQIVPGCIIIETNGLTEGAACTTMLAEKYIDNNEHLLIANSDQWVEWESNEFMYSMTADEIDAGILTFESAHPKWSYAKLDDNGFVEEVAEKRPISKHATVGIYYWKHGSDYCTAVRQMIEQEDRHNGEFYVCPAFNHALNLVDQFKIKTFDVPKMWGLGTPEDLDTFKQKGPLK